MFKLLLVCSGGYTSSTVAHKLEEQIEENQLPYAVRSTNAATGLSVCREYDLALLSPQISFTYELFEKKMRVSGRRPLLLGKEEYFFGNVGTILCRVEEELSLAARKPLHAAFVCGEREMHLFKECFKGVQHLSREKKMNLEVSLHVQREILEPDFSCDIIVFDFLFTFKGTKNPERGFFGVKQIPFFILHLWYVSGRNYAEVIKQIFLEYNLAYENLEIEE